MSYLGAGSIIYVTNNSASPFVYTSSNEFRGLTLYYPNQLITAATPTVYPATFAPTASPPDAGATINFVRWKDCQAINAYDFINAVVPQGGFEYDDLTIGALHVGINSDGSGGGPEIGKIVFSYWQWGAGAAVTWAASNATNLILGRSDGFSIRRMIGGACKIGLLTQYSTISGWSAYFPWGQISNMDIDAAQIGWQNQASDITVSNFRGNNLLYDYYVPSGFSNATAAYFSNIDCSGGTQTYTFYVHSQGRLNINGGSLYMNGATNCIKMDAGGWFTLNGVQFLGSSSPLAISPAITELILLGNSFQSAPTLTSPPATNYRFVGNMNLSDH